MSHKYTSLTLAFLAAIFLGHSSTSRAASVVWSPTVTTIVNNNDVLTQGTLAIAYTFIQTGFGPGVPPVVNGTSFTLAFPNAMPASLSGTNYVGVSWTNTTEPYNSLSTEYKNVLRHFWKPTNGVTPLTLTTTGLVASQTYLLQIWFADGQAASAAPSTYTINGVTSAAVDPNTTNVLGGLGQWTTGTVTLGAGETSLTLSASSGITALQLRAVPEPSTFAVLAFGGVVFFTLSHYRRRRSLV